jgi:hypothetical protein
MHFLTPFIRDGELLLDWDDEVLAGSVLTRDGAIVNKGVRERIEGPDAPPAPQEQAAQEAETEGTPDENIPTSPEAPEVVDAARHEAASAPPAPDDAPGEQGGTS